MTNRNNVSQKNTCDWIICDRCLITAGLFSEVEMAAHYLTYSTSRLVKPVHTRC